MNDRFYLTYVNFRKVDILPNGKIRPRPKGQSEKITLKMNVARLSCLNNFA
jgi:hypothetical protein